MNVVDVADNNILTPHIGSDDALASNGDLAIIGEGDILIVDAMIGDESFVG